MDCGLEGCKGKETPITKEGPEKSMSGESLDADTASKARTGLAILNYVAQDGPDLAVTARVLSQRMSAPTEGTEHCLNCALLYLASHPHGVLMFPCGSVDETLPAWADIDWSAEWGGAQEQHSDKSRNFIGGGRLEQCSKRRFPMA